MLDLFSNAQQIRKPAVVSEGGIVAAQSRKAAQICAEVLAAGGDSVDAVTAGRQDLRADLGCFSRLRGDDTALRDHRGFADLLGVAEQVEHGWPSLTFLL